MFSKRLARLYRRQKGLTLIEVLVSVAIMAALGTAIASALNANASSRRVLDEKIQATNLVTEYLEAIRQLSYSANASPYNTVSNNITMPTQYIVAMNIAYSNDGNSWDTTNHSGTWKLQKITISVSRTTGRLVLTTCTFRTPRIK